MPLDWCNAKTSAHRANLSVFRCTAPEQADFDEEISEHIHDLPWEFEVQDYINRLHVPAYKPEFLLLGYDDVGLAAVIELKVVELDRYVFIRAVAVAQRVSGNGLAGEAIGLVPRVISKYDITYDFTVEARIDVDNISAKSAFMKSGYEYVETPAGSQFETWARHFS